MGLYRDMVQNVSLNRLYCILLQKKFQILVKAQDSKRETCVLFPRFVSGFKLNNKND